jgi:hypothetical protein
MGEELSLQAPWVHATRFVVRIVDAHVVMLKDFCPVLASRPKDITVQ